ncbi:MAG: threonine-phosphate decarboxylase [Thermoleophilia bacterium]|nr:threonine-phosphate decarboxylase [Thermoleophilia bacterium]
MSPHGGNIRRLAEAAGVAPQDLVDFSANINPLGPPEWLRTVISAHVDDLRHYPDPESSDLVEAIGARYGVAPGCVVVGNGSADLLSALPRVLRGCSQVAGAVIPVPAYVDYAAAAAAAGLAVENVPLDESNDFAMDMDEIAARLDGGEMVLIGRPNNPTGAVCPLEELVALVSQHRRTWFVVDEAFVEFVSDEAGSADPGLLALGLSNLIVMRSFTKFYAVPGLRLGFAVAPGDVAAALRRALAPWSVNALAQAVGVAALADQEFAAETRRFVREERRWLLERLCEVRGLRVFPGSVNYVLVKIDRDSIDAVELAGRLLRQGLAVRVCDDFEGLDRRFLRVAVRTREENDRLASSLRAVLEAGDTEVALRQKKGG